MSMYEAGNNQNNNNSGEYKEAKVYTSGITLKNYTSTMMPCAYEQKSYNDKISVSFYPELPKNLQTEKRIIDWKNPISTLLVPEKAMGLYIAYEKGILPALEAGEEFSASIIIADVNAIRISTGVAEFGEVRPYIQILKGIDPETLRTEVEVRYEFKPAEIITNYNPTEGVFGGKMIVHTELITIMEHIKEFVIASGNAVTHSSRVVNKFANDKLSGNIEKIGEKVGAAIQKRSYSNNADYRGSNSHSPLFGGGNNSNPVPEVPEESYSSLEDLEI